MRRSILVIIALILFAGFSSRVLAHDQYITTTFDNFIGQQYTHEDEDPFKGYLSVNVTNNTSRDWTDFHFEIIDVGWDVSNVDFIDTPGYEPNSTQGPLTWVIDNSVVGATLDLYFASDPVLVGESATFDVYTDNTIGQQFFGVLLYPTPEPATIALLGLGALVLLRKRK